ncbi:MAG: TetR/AcrR family transcriptional regulator [Rubricoccaceae bacterium]|nr:TetR/AcrR family transcriptional regulator [Rubricoccaceae bacterium]
MSENRPNGAALRRAILDETRHLLIAEGYHNLSMRKIARAVGCSATSIYLHFENKDALIHALIDEGMERLHEHLVASSVNGDPLSRLQSLARAYVQFGLKNPEYYQVMFQLHPERMERYPAENYRRARRNLEIHAEALAAGIDAGVFQVDSTETGAHVLWTALHGLVSLLLAQRVDVKLADEAFIEAAINHALEGFKA